MATQSNIHAEQMTLIERESKVSIIGSLVTAAFYTYILSGKVLPNILFSWFAAITLLYIVRWTIVHYVYRLDTTIAGNSYKWEMINTVGVFTSGLMWGVGSYFILPENNSLLACVIVLTIGGLVGASSVMYASSKYMGIAFSLPALLPLSLYFFIHDGVEYFYMGVLVLIYLLVTFTSNRIMYKTNLKGIMLGVKNDVLIDDLKNKMLKIESITGEMSYQASHDMLTGLINRREFEVRLEKAIRTIKKNKVNYVLCYMDLDEFKIVNDSCGHVAGDVLLQNIAKQLSEKIRNTDTIARLGGDEFGLLLPFCNINKAHEIANSLRKTIEDFHFVWDDKVFNIGVSIGLVGLDDSVGSLTDVLKSADSACYVAKELGKNRIHIYQENDENLTQRLGDIYSAESVQKSLTEERFVLYAQEIYANHESSIKWHGEILIRMLSDNNDIILPDKFIPAAERYHLMNDVDKWVIDKAFLFIKQLEDKYDNDVLCAINLSGQSICDEEFIDYIISKLDKYKISASSVCFEITEADAVSNFFHAEKLLYILRNMGFSFSLDDFGSGLSSFGYLKRLNVDYLKIDGGFIESMLDDEKDNALVKSINQIGKEMKVKTIAEFVGNQALYKKLAEMEVDYFQGNYLAEPVPLSLII